MKWKYKVIALSNEEKADAKVLNSLGSAGWELVAVSGEGQDWFAYLKAEATERERVIKL